MNQKEAQALVKKHGSISAAARASSMPRTTLSDVYNGVRETVTRQPANDQQPATKRLAGVAVAKFLHQFDYEAQLMRTLRRLCGKRFMADHDIRAAASLPAAVYRRVTDLPAFEDWKIKIDGRLWWSAPSNIKQVRAQQTNWGLR